jgi:hypothetical protein
MSLLILLNLLLAFSTLDEAKSSAFFNWFHLEETSAADRIVTFEPTGARYHGKVKVVVKTDGLGNIQNTKLLVKHIVAREIAKSFLKQQFDGEDLAHLDQLLTAADSHTHFESRFPSGALLTMDDEDGWRVIFAGRNDGPRLGLSFSSYKLRMAF